MARKLSDILESEAGSLVIVADVCDLICQYAGGVAITWLSPPKR